MRVLAAAWMKDGRDALGVVADVALRFDCVEIRCQQLSNLV
jgi:hypothetical protein